MSDEPLSKNQIKAINLALDQPESLWFMPPGMGKTRSWLDMINSEGDRTLVVAPRLVAQNTWPDENKKWGLRLPMRFMHGPQKHLRGKELISLINYEALPWLCQQLKGVEKPVFKQVIFDEISKMKNINSVRSTAWADLRGRIEYKNGGTGTPVGAHPIDLFGECFAVDGGKTLGEDFDRFRRRYFSEDKHTGMLTPYHDAMSEILGLMRKTTISFDINDLNMPPIKHIPIYLDLPEKARAAYQEMHDESVVEELDLYAVNAAVKSGKLRQMASGGVIDINGSRRYLHTSKADRLLQILDDAQGRPVLVFFEFVSDYVSICQAFGKEVPVLYGKTKAKDAKRWIRDWNAGRLPLFALHPRSAGHGLNLQDSGNIVVFYTLPWSYELVNQGIARLWRQGQKNKVLVYYLIVEQTKDEDVLSRVEDREDMHNLVMKALQ